MKAFKGTFKKKNGEIREMLFAHLRDLPDTFLDEKIIGSGSERSYPDALRLAVETIQIEQAEAIESLPVELIEEL